MAIKQTRRTISINRALYEQVRLQCDVEGKAMSAWLHEAIGSKLRASGVVDIAPHTGMPMAAVRKAKWKRLGNAIRAEDRMTTSALTEDERNKLVDLVHRRGGDELLATEVVQWAESVRTSADQLELVLRGFLAPTMRDNGELALVPLHCAVPASSPALEFTSPDEVSR